MKPEQWKQVIDTNLGSLFNMCRPVIEGMRERKFGRIVNISSINGQKGQMGQTNYSAAKAGEIGFTKALAQEGARAGITVNAIAPGYIRTELNVPLQQDRKFCAMLEQRTAAHRWGTPADLRGALLLLASDASAYITGHTLVVDGGMTTILA